MDKAEWAVRTNFILRGSRMDQQQFWTIIESSGRTALNDPERQLDAVRDLLSTLPPAEVIDFGNLFNQKLADAYTWDLWGAAYLINGGCSDDGFYCFRAWLISRGRAVFEAAVQNPDSLAGQTDPGRDDYEFEELWYVPQEVYQELTGEELPPAEICFLAEPKGEPWDYDDDEQVFRRLPRLAKIYLQS
jgi:hypothetical protein